MSHPNDLKGKKLFAVSSKVDSVSKRFSSILAAGFEEDKPDSNGFGAGLPVTPLRTITTVTNTSSSSSSSGSIVGRNGSNSYVNRSHSGELPRSSESSPTAVDSVGSVENRNVKPGHRRSCSGPLIYSGTSATWSGSGSISNSPVSNVLPAGNICPSGKIVKTGMLNRNAVRSDVLGLGTGNYGHGSIIRGGTGAGKMFGEMPPLSNVDSSTTVRKALVSVDPEEVKRVANELYRKGQFSEAVRLYDRAISMVPNNALLRSNRAAALMGMGKLDEAVRDCEEAVKFDPGSGRVHQRLASLHLRLGQVENARKHLYFTGELPDPIELQKLQSVERHLCRSTDARRIGDWKALVKESDGAIAAGADSSYLLIASKAEALLRLNRPDEADAILLSSTKLETSSPSCLPSKFFGMLSDSYLYVVRSQVDMALGRFENAEIAAEKAHMLDPQNIEVETAWKNAKSVARARARGNELFNSGRFADACLAYEEGLMFDPSNSVLRCNRAVCHSKLGLWEKSVDDCNHALKVQPNYTKALLRRAASYGKLERWAEAVCDYEILRKELPTNKEIAEALFHAQVAWKACRGEEVSNMKFGGQVEKITGLEQLHAAISLPGLLVVYYMGKSDQNSIKISPFVDIMCTQHPSVNFLKVDVDEFPAIAHSENVKIVPTFKIYKDGTRMKEMICPSQQVLEYFVRHYDVQQ